MDKVLKNDSIMKPLDMIGDIVYYLKHKEMYRKKRMWFESIVSVLVIQKFTSAVNISPFQYRW